MVYLLMGLGLRVAQNVVNGISIPIKTCHSNLVSHIVAQDSIIQISRPNQKVVSGRLVKVKDKDLKIKQWWHL